MSRYREGDWFAVPLRDRGFAVGVVARTAPERGLLLGYFFGPRLEAPPDLDYVSSLRPEDALMVRLFGDMGILEGDWPVLGAENTWDSSLWPIPVFSRIDELAGLAYRIEYPRGDLDGLREETRVLPHEVSGFPREASMASGAVEVVLTKLIGA